MGLLLDWWLSELILVLAAAFAALYLYFSHAYGYWAKKGVKQLQPTFPFGNIGDIVFGRRSAGDVMKDIYSRLKGHRFGGIYGISRPILFIRDPDLIRNVLVKDFTLFMDRGISYNEDEPLNQHLFILGGQKWRRLRVKMTPTFTSGKLKMMFSIIEKCGREMAAVLDEMADRGETVEMREMSARYTTDIIASVAFGIECNCQRDPNNEFREWGRNVFKPTLKGGISNFLAVFYPKLGNILKIRSGGEEISVYFRNMVKETLEYREKNNISRKDFMQLLLQLKTKGFVEDDKRAQEDFDNWKLSDDEVAAQAFVFFVAGFETSSTTMSFAMHELSRRPDIQEKLQQEIDSVMQKHGGDLTYEAVNEMSYLGMVISETLRKYPPLPALNRVCSEQYNVPDSDVVLEKDTPIFIPVLGLHMDPEYFPDPERFDPERFSETNKEGRHPYVYLPFGEGPRNCIGMRLGLLQTKVGLTYLLSKFSVRPTDKANAKIRFNPRSLILMADSGINLTLSKRT